ncbi:hypothetical protein BD324DRAFT_620478 [Kockovaella imperatae]|uniref:Chromosome transmission fidelity protein 8 n=1 Tax=Kockovaella imperatae TaxID=4999 RepID=A0A1Y1UJV8_9TREE|nr:hypothetical protein BD324DRAFT_620478 [Kockovaella imperatae]ORX38338.1 hypothetical protein BD324DRAFT_620478 [Kockovaella imperatae]
MRIHLSVNSHQLDPSSGAGPSSGPLAKIGGELVLIELQGELSWEGEQSGKVVGVLGLDRPDKPTLHLGEHHLLHGKITTLQKPYAVIRRQLETVPMDDEEGDRANQSDDGEAADDDHDDEDDTTPDKKLRSKHGQGNDDEEDEEDEEPLFPLSDPIRTPHHTGAPPSSSPIYPPSVARDYSSELGFSSPARWDAEDEQEDEDEEAQTTRAALEIQRLTAQKRRGKRKRGEKQVRTKHYEVVGVVWKKVVFALRPEPIVTATVLPE